MILGRIKYNGWKGQYGFAFAGPRDDRTEVYEVFIDWRDVTIPGERNIYLYSGELIDIKTVVPSQIGNQAPRALGVQIVGYEDFYKYLQEIKELVAQYLCLETYDERAAFAIQNSLSTYEFIRTLFNLSEYRRKRLVVRNPINKLVKQAQKMKTLSIKHPRSLDDVEEKLEQIDLLSYKELATVVGLYANRLDHIDGPLFDRFLYFIGKAERVARLRAKEGGDRPDDYAKLAEKCYIASKFHGLTVEFS